MALNAEDELAIHRLLAAYSHAVSECSVENWTDLFTEDAVWERKVPATGSKYNEAAVYEGRDSIRELAATSFEPGVQYLSMNAVVSGDGDAATGFSTVLVLAAGPDGELELVVTGNFEDEYRRTEDGWKFARRAISLLGSPAS